MLEKAGIKTVYKTIYPAETTDLIPVMQKVASAKPDAVIGGTQNVDAYAQVKAMVQLKFSPKFVFLSNGPNNPAEFPSKVGREERQRHLQRRRLVPAVQVLRQRRVRRGVPQGVRRHGDHRSDVGRGLRGGPARRGRRDEDRTRSTTQTIIATLHKGSWPTVEGVLRWNAIGEPQGSDLLVEWINGKLYPVYPPSVALHKPVVPEAGVG